MPKQAVNDPANTTTFQALCAFGPILITFDLALAAFRARWGVSDGVLGISYATTHQPFRDRSTLRPLLFDRVDAPLRVSGIGVIISE